MIIEYLLFLGSSLYLISSLMFFYLFIRTLKTTDGIGLVFLKILTISLSLSSLIIFTIRIASEYGSLDLLTARAIAVISPLLLCAVALYLNFLFNNPQKVLKSIDSKNIEKIKEDVKVVKEDVKVVKENIV
jgi:16S rRNA G527 N7-methylase RsmG